jgi:hypothetical protein
MPQPQNDIPYTNVTVPDFEEVYGRHKNDLEKSVYEYDGLRR